MESEREMVIEAAALSKRFGEFVALSGLDLSVARGEVHGFLGPNGAGKSTTIRILLGLVRSSGGTARLFGRDPWTDAVALHDRLAYVPGDVSLWPALTGGECLDVLASVHGGFDPRRRVELIERFELDPGKRSRDYSKGNRQKVALVAALATRSELLILDEPTSGLDPLMEQVFQDVVRERAHDGATVLLSSHILAEVEALADRVSIIRRGRTVSCGTLEDMRRRAATRVRAVTDAAPAGLSDAAGVTAVHVERAGERFAVSFHVDADDVREAMGVLTTVGLRSITATPPSLDEMFLRSYDESAEPAVVRG
ncbi:ABC transporter ATP-binding protein [Rhodococcus maanshanensis]|uniref:ABC-2 type transport system ATP-binding protein n=1 Tax=Rhodococcus maanshanensis TaxID=183556 RepID=A0A1H7R0D3_9NOCA|nr:ABC transporter ATP-binding protein [Rhodococcus maanshanensis]SEL53375.1 ABC-2 type transport system ATP-binding protein [Rhodococcus maanshanensis]